MAMIVGSSEVSATSVVLHIRPRFCASSSSSMRSGTVRSSARAPCSVRNDDVDGADDGSLCNHCSCSAVDSGSDCALPPPKLQSCLLVGCLTPGTGVQGTRW
jgi:hypothetical protein